MSSRFLRRLIPALYFGLMLGASAAPVQILAYEPQDEGAPNALRARYRYFNQLATDFFDMDRAGKITGHVPQDDVAFAQAQKVPVYATVSNFAGSDFNADIAHAVITSPDATKTFLDDAIKLLAANHYAGLNIDIESVHNTDRASYTAFIETVAKTLRPAGFLTIVSVPAAAADDPTNSWTGAYDLKALGASVDLLQVMTYDENGSWGAAGPIAGLDWVEAAIRYTASVVPGEKISMGVPAFAYDWDLDDSHRNKQINWTDIAPLLEKMHGEAHWDDASSSPNFTYMSGGHRHIVWHENAKSLALKAQLVAKYKIAGLSIWCLGQEDDAFWRALKLGP